MKYAGFSRGLLKVSSAIEKVRERERRETRKGKEKREEKLAIGGY